MILINEMEIQRTGNGKISMHFSAADLRYKKDHSRRSCLIEIDNVPAAVERFGYLISFKDIGNNKVSVLIYDTSNSPAIPMPRYIKMFHKIGRILKKLVG